MKKVYTLFIAILFVSSAIAQVSMTRTLSLKEQKPAKAPTHSVAELQAIFPNYQAPQPISVDLGKPSSNKDIQVDYFTEDFTGGLVVWGNFDEDSDGNFWEDGGGAAISASFINGVGAVTPNNWLISPGIDLSAATSVGLSFEVSALDPDWAFEHYKVVVSTTGSTPADFSNPNIVFEETLPGPGPYTRLADLSAYAGQTIYVAFVHYNCTDQFYVIIDNIVVFENDIIDAEVVGIPGPNNDSGCGLSASENIVVSIRNNGGATISNFDVSYTVDGGAPVTETVTASVSAAQVYDYTFTATEDFSTFAYYDIVATVSLTNDAVAANDSYYQEIRSTDGLLTTNVQTPSNSDMSWYLYTLAGDTVIYHGGYQWNLTLNEVFCVLSDDCYTFSFEKGTDGNGDPGLGMDADGYLEVSFNGSVVGGTTTPGQQTDDFTIDFIGNGCSGIEDIGVVGFLEPAGCANSATQVVTATIENFGTDPISNFDVSYTLDGGAPVTETVAGPLAAGATIDHTFATTADFSSTSTIVLEGYTTYAGDINAGNDAFTVNILDGDGASISITILPDTYPEETYWGLWDADGNLIASLGEPITGNPDYVDGVEQTTDICVNSTGCYTFQLYDSYGDGIYAPGYCIVNFAGVDVYNSGAGGFTTDLEIVMNIGNGCPALDVGAASIDGYNYLLTNTPVTFTGELFNIGTDNVTAVDLSYQVNGGAVLTSNLTGISLNGNGGLYSYTHGDVWTPSAPGTYEIAMWTSNPNGSADEDTSNDTVYKTITVADQLAQRMALMEGFTSSTCAPCAAVNPDLDILLNNNVAKICATKYHVWWPSPGDDPMYAYNTADVDDRVAYYGVNSVPNSVLGAFNGNSGDIDQTMIDEEYAKPAPVTIDGQHTLSGQTLTITGDITAIAPVNSADLVYHIALNEAHINYAVAPGSNGETDFSHVMRNMIPSFAGTAISALAATDVVTINETWTVDGAIDLAEVEVVVWLQDVATQEVHQAAVFELFNADNSLEAQTDIRIYPNPVKEQLNITNVENSTIYVYNMMGTVVGVINSKNPRATIDVSSYAQGTYIIKVLTNNEVVTSKFNVIR